jgi:hypothetical protein
MSDKRDPRVDPRPGDWLKKGKENRYVDEFHPKHNRGGYFIQGWVLIACKFEPSGYRAWKSPSIQQWRKWAEKAEVIHAAD